NWIKPLAAIKSELGDEGFELVDKWSQGADSYNAKDMRDTYRSLKASGGITIGTLFYYARQYGYTGSLSSRPNHDELAKRKLQAQQSELDKKKLSEAAAKIASKVYHRAIAICPAGHEYLISKKVHPVPTIRVIQQAELEDLIGYLPKANGEQLSGSILVAPFTIDGNITTIEMIDGKGRKSSLAKGIKSGAFWSSRDLNKEESYILIAEGIATALSAAEATGLPAVSAGSC
ncbi:MAG: PriCT-2 domain-containing protein, partial [Chlorobium sp.]|nr:PriCT-2 domain-containing protein [Chlorobium sp.]